MFRWTVEASVKGRIVVRETFDSEKEAKEEFDAFCFDNKVSREMPGPGITLYDDIELYKQNTDTGEILEKKVRSFR